MHSRLTGVISIFGIFHIFSLLSRVLQKIQQDQATGLLLCPYWPTQPWFPVAMQLLIDRPPAGPAKKTTSPSHARATRSFTRAPPTGTPAVDGLPLVGCFLTDQGISGQTAAVITSAWRQSTIKQYRTYLRKWEEYCGR